ncbi:family 20 glycosylhydrolase [Arenibacter sp. F20364]|uniref:beta-N-acetylhexosaminidase n=1 Tax=Arenibacter sp. F20364 TaxID=2926415 RepID=UPI001FF2A51E|nr:family 20 glycosylhydrolase [Arenibacter sp. F20364]MCK0188527.1 family 20 glycosylhydrolase [Arenibacter sp. F20364]
MKKIKGIYLLAISILIFSCTPKEKKLGDFALLPQHQEFEITGVSSISFDQGFKVEAKNNEALPIIDPDILVLDEHQGKATLTYEIDSNMDIAAEGYTLNILDQQIHIKGKDEAGLFYAFKTLEQLTVDAKDQKVNLPLCQLKDYPLLAYRSVQLDVKHHLEKTEYYYELLDKFASYKINGIILEVEDKLKFKRQPVVASADALSIEEWKKISDYAKERHIEISPLVQGLGHASFILKHPEYMELRDNPESDWAFNPLDPKTYEVQFDLYLDAMEAFPYGKYLHVGGDEVHTTGRGSKESPLKLQLMWLDKVAKFAEEHGRTPIFWDDMPLKQADVYDPMFKKDMTQEEVDQVWKDNEHKLLEFLDIFPKNCIYMRWNYSSPQALGNIKAMQWFTDHGMEVMGATAGQTRWVLMPQEESNMENIRSFAVSSINSGLNGLLLTLWDDDSPHFELYMRGILAFAEYSWIGDKRGKDEIKSSFRQREYGYTMADEGNAFITELETPVAFWKNALLKKNQRNFLHKMEDPLEEAVIDLPNKENNGAWSLAHEERLKEASLNLAATDSIAKIIENARSLALRNDHNLQVYEQVNKLAQFSPKMLLALRDYDKAESREDIIATASKLKELESEFGSLRKELEMVYGKTRILNKPDNYILDQDHHVHLANQSINFDWQFYAEIMFFKKLNNAMKKEIYMENADPLKK